MDLSCVQWTHQEEVTLAPIHSLVTVAHWQCSSQAPSHPEGQGHSKATCSVSSRAATFPPHSEGRFGPSAPPREKTVQPQVLHCRAPKGKTPASPAHSAKCTRADRRGGQRPAGTTRLGEDPEEGASLSLYRVSRQSGPLCLHDARIPQTVRKTVPWNSIGTVREPGLERDFPIFHNLGSGLHILYVFNLPPWLKSKILWKLCFRLGVIFLLNLSINSRKSKSTCTKYHSLQLHTPRANLKFKTSNDLTPSSLLPLGWGFLQWAFMLPEFGIDDPGGRDSLLTCKACMARDGSIFFSSDNSNLRQSYKEWLPNRDGDREVGESACMILRRQTYYLKQLGGNVVLCFCASVFLHSRLCCAKFQFNKKES